MGAPTTPQDLTRSSLSVLFMVGLIAASFWILRPFIPALAIPMIVLFVLSNVLRWWVIRTMAEHWNVQVVNSLELGVVTRGPATGSTKTLTSERTPKAGR